MIRALAVVALASACTRKPTVWHTPVPMHCPVQSAEDHRCVGDDGRVYVCVYQYGDRGLDIFCALAPTVPQ